MSKIAVNVRSEKAYYKALEQLEQAGYITPLNEYPTNMHRWDEYGRETVLFVDDGIITYQSTEYAKDEGYDYVRFKPRDDIMMIIEKETIEC